MTRQRTTIALILCVAAPASAQMGVYDDEPQSLEDAERNRSSITLRGDVSYRLVPESHVVRPGDTLWDVTGHYYGNPWEWPRVWSYNPEITNPHWIYPQGVLRLMPGAGAQAQPSGPLPAGPSVRSSARGMPAGSVFLRQEGYLDQEALAQAGVIVGSPEDHMLLAPYDEVYVEFDENMSGTPRGEFTVFREIGQDERQPGEEGTLVRIFGTVQIESYDAEQRTARARVIDALDPIERGYRVAPMPRQFDMVPPQPADRDLATHVAAALRPREILGEQQVVFVPVGREEGVRMGNRFFIVSAGDPWREQVPGSANNAGATVDAPPQPEQLPTEILAEARVVHVRPHSATLMITRSVREARVGDHAQMRRGY
jgi:hypothetical protein